MKFAHFCIKHPVTTIMAYVMIVIFGILGFSSLPLALMPNIELPMAVVVTTYSGAGPEEIENLVTKTIESACASVSGMESLQSQSSEGTSTVMVSFADGTNMDETLVDMRDKIAQVSAFLPEDASSPMVMKINMDAMPVIMLGLRGAELAQLQSIAEDDLSPVLERIDGVASITIEGGYDNEIAVYTNAEQMNGYGLSISYISQLLAAENIAVPAGNVNNGNQTLSVRTTGEFSSTSDIENMLIPLPRGGSVRLGDIASVSMQHTDQTEISKINGDECVTITIQKQSDVNTVQVANKIKAALDTFTSENPTLETTLLMDQSDYINMSVDSVVQNILLGVVLAAVVLFVFLRDAGATAVISISMPVCIVSVFLVMIAFDITVNMMSLGGLAMGVGMIVDNSIVVLENIFRYRMDGYSRLDSCIKGTGEVALSISAGTLTTIAVFLPIGLSGGIAGMMFREFSITISSLLFASLIIALTLVPLMCYLLLDRGKNGRKLLNTSSDIADRPLMRKYKDILNLLITKRKIGVIASIALILVFGLSIFITGFELIPEVDEGQISVTIDMPVGAELEETAAIADRVSVIAEETIPELQTLSYTSTEDTTMTLDIGSKSDRDRSVWDIANALRSDLSDIAGCEITVSSSGTMDMSALSGSPISVTLKGDDYELLTETGEKLVEELATIPTAIDVASSAGDEVPQVDIVLRRTDASRFGLTTASIGQIVRSELSGTTATQLKVDGEEITVSVKGDERSAESLDALRAVPVPLQTGGTIPLGSVADVNVVLAPQMIVRQNQSRTITISGDTSGDDLVALNTAVSEKLENFTLPDGITIETGGEMEEMLESFVSLGYALIVGLVLIYFVLASQFESFIMPIMVMMILPVGLIGSLIGLPFTGQKISMISFIGVIMLSGTVVNSSIVLVDYINTRRGRGESKNEAILNACPRRIRPILMTTLTTILGLLPMALGTGESSELMIPMAVVMITGMVVSTIITLFFTPVYYSLIDSISARLRRRKKSDDNSDDSNDNADAALESAGVK